jgi:hypothetical protein
MPVDVVPSVCKQGVSGSSRLSFTQAIRESIRTLDVADLGLQVCSNSEALLEKQNCLLCAATTAQSAYSKAAHIGGSVRVLSSFPGYSG